MPPTVTLPETLFVPALQSFTLAILLFFVGQKLATHWEPLRRYNIPEPVVGGFLCACVVGLAYLVLGVRIEFDLQVRDTLPLYFFAGIGLKSDLKTLKAGGRPLAILLVLAMGKRWSPSTSTVRPVARSRAATPIRPRDASARPASCCSNPVA